MSERELWIVRQGVTSYAEILELQRRIAAARITGEISQDVLLALEHSPVITLGRSSKEQNLVASKDFLALRGVELHEVERGGDVTFHGPGQLVGYPIIDLKRHKQDLHWYLRQLEQATIDTLAKFGIQAERSTGYTGVWTKGKKIASIGVHARDWVTWHGLALNVSTDLSFFDFIVPCGIAGVVMTSIERETAEAVTVERTAEVFAAQLASLFDLTPVETSVAELFEAAA
ncbi:MAG: lipoyl(octanoyl) transferase LipB [Gemmatimonadaceae bacterium]|nr:lipoyl(octanoyl) transferase LipB [Gemmatimonadaceae bacterium]